MVENMVYGAIVLWLLGMSRLEAGEWACDGWEEADFRLG